MQSPSELLRLFDADREVIEHFNDFGHLIRAGFPKEWPDRFFEATKIDRSKFPRLAESATDLNPGDSDLLFRLAKVYSEATDFFQDAASASEWLMTKSTTLGGIAPYQILDTTAGYETVIEELQRLQYGIAS